MSALRASLGIHTCHAGCPCQTGGEPVSDFIEETPMAEQLRQSAERMPTMIAMCTHPDGVNEHVAITAVEQAARCFQPGCNCVPKVYVECGHV